MAGRWGSAVTGFLSWLRNGRTAEHAVTTAGNAPSAQTLEARLAALISFYRWQEACSTCRSLAGCCAGCRAAVQPAGCWRTWMPAPAPGPSSLVRFRRQRGHDQPPILLPQQIQAILDGCAVYDTATGQWEGNLRDRLIFAVLAETGMRLGELLGMRISDFVMGRGGTPFVEIVPREDNPNAPGCR